MNRMKTVLGVSIAALIAFGGVLSVADVGQAGERDRKGDREWRDEGDWKGEWKRDRDDDDDRDDDWRGRRGYGRGYWGGYGRATGVGTDAIMVIIADRDTTLAGAAGCIGTH